MQKITPMLWFDNNAEDAVKFYTSVFKDAKITRIAHYSKGSPAPEGSVMTVEFELFGQEFVALNAGPMFKFNEAISFVVNCQDQQEVDYYWNKLTADGGEESMCGWLKDKFGLSWQITPRILTELTAHPDKDKASRAMQAMMKMKKIDIAKIVEAAQ
jgi:predicted 3-demethylubiquinone-9 3-methyltransferase (glyoxalase superfamily)